MREGEGREPGFDVGGSECGRGVRSAGVGGWA